MVASVVSKKRPDNALARSADIPGLFPDPRADAGLPAECRQDGGAELSIQITGHDTSYGTRRMNYEIRAALQPLTRAESLPRMCS